MARRRDVGLTARAFGEAPRARNLPRLNGDVLSNFGAQVTLGALRIDCAAIALDGEMAPFAATPPVKFQFSDTGGNVCGCGVPAPCHVLSSTLTAPSELPQGPDVGGKSK